jgi:ribosomal protein S6
MEKQIYELSYWLKADEQEENIKFEDIFKNFDFEVIQEIQPKIKHMAYPIKKENIGKFGTFYFYGQKDKIEDFKNKIKSIDRILRFVILKRKSFKINSK